MTKKRNKMYLLYNPKSPQNPLFFAFFRATTDEVNRSLLFFMRKDETQTFQKWRQKKGGEGEWLHAADVTSQYRT